MVTMTLGTLSVCMTVLVLNLHHRGSKHTPPSWVSTLVLIYLAKLVCMQVDVPAPLYSQRRREKLLCHVCCRLDEAARESDPDGGNHAKRTDCNSLPLQLLTIPQRRQKQQQTVANHNNLQSVWMKRIAEDRDDLPTGQKRKNADEIAEDMKTSTDEKDSDEEISSSSFCSPNSCPISLNKSLPKIPKLCFKQRKTRTDIECHSCSNPGRQACPQTPVNYSIISDINRTFCETRSNRNHFSRGVVTEPRDKSKSSENRAENVEHEWHEIARVLDRVFFWVIFLMMSASTAVILFYPKYSNLPKDDDWRLSFGSETRHLSRHLSVSSSIQRPCQ